jgi:hypothetical protein
MVGHNVVFNTSYLEASLVVTWADSSRGEFGVIRQLERFAGY